MCIVISTLFERENMSKLLITNRPLSLASARAKLNARRVCLLKVLTSTTNKIPLQKPVKCVKCRLPRKRNVEATI